MTEAEKFIGISELMSEFLIKSRTSIDLIDIELFFYMSGEYLCMCHAPDLDSSIVLAHCSGNHWDYFLSSDCEDGLKLLIHATTKIKRRRMLYFLNQCCELLWQEFDLDEEAFAKDDILIYH